MQEQEPKGAQLKYHFEAVQITAENRFDVMGRVMPFHNQLLLAKGRTLKELDENIQIGGEALFAVLEDPEPKDIGVVLGRVKQVRLSGINYNVYMRYLRVVAPDSQQEGIATEFTNETVKRLYLAGIALDGFVGRTPNPEIHRAGELSPYIGTIHPIHKLHNHLTIALLGSALDERYKENLDFVTGRCEAVYPKGDPFRLFDLHNASRRVRTIYRIVTSPPINADLANGDGVIYYEKVVRELLDLPPKAA